jgi:hypothetical protein
VRRAPRALASGMALTDLADNATVQLFPIDPPVDAEQAAALCANIAKLFAQFARDGAVGKFAAEVAASGAILAVAYESGAPISGCSKDMLAKVVKQWEERTAHQVLSAPPIVVEVGGVPRALTRAALRALAAAGAVTPESRFYDTSITTLGDWRARGSEPLAQTWIAKLLTR